MSRETRPLPAKRSRSGNQSLHSCPPNRVVVVCTSRKINARERHRGQPRRQCLPGWIRENSFRDRTPGVHRIETRRLNRPALPAGAGAKEKRFGLHSINILSHRSPALSSQRGSNLFYFVGFASSTAGVTETAQPRVWLG